MEQQNKLNQEPIDSSSEKKTTFQLAASLSAALLVGWLLVGDHGNSAVAGQSNFMGGAPSIEDSEDVSTLRLLFPAGVRSNWHSHTWGQLLMLEKGKGLTQNRGGPVIEVGPFEPWFTPAGVEHWHGASQDEDAHQLTIYAGDVEWLEGVSDREYMAEAKQ